MECKQPEFRNIIRLIGKASVPLLEATTASLIQNMTGFKLQGLLQGIRTRSLAEKCEVRGYTCRYQ